MGPVCYDYGWPRRRLVESDGGEREYYLGSRLSGVGWRRRFQKGVSDLPITRLPDPAAFDGVSQPHALERVYRRRC